MYLATRRTLIQPSFSHGRRLLSTLKKPEKPFLNAYNAKAVEEGWYDYWQRAGLFKPMTASSASNDIEQKKKKQFTMITPPPNVTGSLHIGHALTLSLEDALARYRRMAGHDVQWIPGTDHAGIGTQSVVEKMMMRERQLSRHDMGREDFVKEIWKWRQKYGDHILNQMKRMGASVDWDSVFFTMDPTRYQAVQNAFIQLHKDGLIYRDTRLVNWCCELETVISDIEVDYKEIEGRTLVPLPGRPEGVEFGVLHQFTYPIVDPQPGGVQGLTVSTTRIETMLGDCAVAIHPEDPRYKELHGKYVMHPIHKKKIPIICDEQLVDMEFGTGAVKITPAHDPNDYACARRHNLPIVSIFDKLGQLNALGGVTEWTGTNRFDLRDKVVDKLKQLNCYQGKDENHPMRIALCSRSGDVIEPLLQPQWYVRCSELAETSKKQVEDGLMKIHPSGHTQDWYRWLDNIQDWCISRQLWWGHEIPAYQVKLDNMTTDKELWVVAQDEATAHQETTALFEKEGIALDSKYQLVKDEDVLDTWFSSGLLPLSALGWTGPNAKIPERYPIQVMETGYDILFFWVARMTMLANHFAKQPPFENIFLHAMVRDAQGRKMSKSLGNVIDPLHVIEGVGLETMQENVRKSNLPPKEIEKSVKNLKSEYPSGIPACGTDSLRFALIAYTQQSRQINLDMSNVIQTSHFCNKLWNLFKFGFGRFDKDGYPTTNHQIHALANNTELSLVNRFILSRMADTVSKCIDGFENYRLHEAADAVRRFIVEDVCDVYVEFSKATLNKQDLQLNEKEATLNILHACMDTSLRLAHPFMPFITEELWHHLKQKTITTTNNNNNNNAKALMVESYPLSEQLLPLRNQQVENHFKVVLSIIHASRSLRQGHQISIGKELPFTIYCNDKELIEPLRLYMKEIQSFVKGSDLSIVEQEIDGGDWTVRAIDDNLKILVPTNHVVRAQLERGGDIVKSIEAKRTQLNKKLDKIQKEADKLAERMNKEGYTEAVPEKVKEKNRQRARGYQLDIETFENDLRLLNNLYKEVMYSR